MDVVDQADIDTDRHNHMDLFSFSNSKELKYTILFVSTYNKNKTKKNK